MLQLRAVNNDERTITFVASDGTRDRYATVLPVNEWSLDNFNRNPVIAYAHRAYGAEDKPNPDYIIGKGRAYIEEGLLLIDIEFEPADINTMADKIYRKIEFGSLNAVSVGFTAKGAKWGTGEESESGKTPTLYYYGLELLEVSVVNIPGNANALRRSLEEMQDEIRELVGSDEPEDKPSDEPEDKPADEVTATTEIERQRNVTMARAALLNV